MIYGVSELWRDVEMRLSLMKILMQILSRTLRDQTCRRLRPPYFNQLPYFHPNLTLCLALCKPDHTNRIGTPRSWLPYKIYCAVDYFLINTDRPY